MQRRWLALPLVIVLAALALVGATRWYRVQSDWQWTDPGVHVADGYYVTTERPCPQDGSDNICAAAVKVATATDPGLTVFTAALAGPPGRWVDSDGVPYRSLGWGGLMGPTFLVLTLATGERRTFPLLCAGDQADVDFSSIVFADVTTGAGPTPSLLYPAVCQAWDAGQYRIGAFLPGFGVKVEQPTSAY